MEPILQEAADLLHAAAEKAHPCDPIQDRIGRGNLDLAYAIQDINVRRKEAAGRRVVGRKIGLTSLAVQKQLGVDQPDFGALLDDMAMPDGGHVTRDQLLQPKAEAEIAFVLGRDLPDPRVTAADLMRAVEYAVAAIEIVDSRIANWKIGIVDTIADNASSGLYVLGSSPRKLESLDLVDCQMALEVDGRQVSAGSGAACLGSPVSAALWLAHTMARLGRPLKEGDTILSGALGPMAPVQWGSLMEAKISGLGSVRISFAEETNT